MRHIYIDQNEKVDSTHTPLLGNSFVWNGIQVNRLDAQPGEHRIPELPVLVVSVHVGAPYRVVQRREGRSSRRQVVDGDVVIIPHGTPNLCVQDTSSEYIAVGIDPQLLISTAEALGLDRQSIEIVNNFGVQDQTLQYTAHALLRERLSPGLGGTLYTESLVNQLIIHLFRTHSAWATAAAIDAAALQSLGKPQLQRALEYILDNLGQNLSLTELAGVAHLSPYHFSRLFKQTIGMAPHQYVLQQRLDRAKRLLVESQMPIAHVASHLGFSDQSHFSYHFKRVFGVTPASLRKSKKVPTE
jgi:AraC family transcriptional regulator